MIRKESTVKQQEVAKIFKVGQSAVTKWKTGKDTPSLPRAVDMAVQHGVCVEWLLTGRGPKFPGGTADGEMSRLLEFWDRLTQDTKRNVVGYAILQRSIQNTASPERIKEVHEKLPEANKIARIPTRSQRS